jgi:hypothetical protein
MIVFEIVEGPGRSDPMADFRVTVANQVPQLARGLVWCTRCGRTEKVNAAECLRYGWPKCHGETMTIDSPEESKRLAGKVNLQAGKEREL